MNPIVAVIPVKDRLDLTANLVAQLREQDECTEIVICDNGSSSGTRKWLHAQPDLTVFDCPDAGLHEMYNRAIDYVLAEHGAGVRVALLNNDLRLGPAFLRLLSFALTDHREFDAVCGNYDGRRADIPIVETSSICAARYDGTGGFAGFACMVRGEWFAAGYRFPEECQWWYGDNDLIAMLAYADHHRGVNDKPHKAGIVVAAEVEHLEGGGATAGDPTWSDSRWNDMKRSDRLAFAARWAEILRRPPPTTPRVAYGACVGSRDRLDRYVTPNIGERPMMALLDQTSIAEAYNTILDAHRGRGFDMLVLVHDDLEITDPNGEAKLLAAVRQPDVALVGVAGARGVSSLAWWEGDTVGHQGTDSTFIDFGAREGEVDMLEGSLLAFSPWAIEHLRFDTRFEGFHGYDEIAMQARAAGKKVVVVDVDTHHHTTLGFTSPESQQTWRRCNELFCEKWGLVHAS